MEHKRTNRDKKRGSRSAWLLAIVVAVAIEFMAAVGTSLVANEHQLVDEVDLRMEDIGEYGRV